MRKIKHLTPRYIINRFRKIMYELQNPDSPLLNRNVINFLSYYMHENDLVLEFGSGKSTIWFAKKSGRVISVESSAYWFDKINNELSIRKLNNVDLKFAKDWNDYLNIIKTLKNINIHICLIDSKEFRSDLMNQIVGYIQVGGLLLIDDANRYFASDSKSPGSFKSATNRDPKMLEFEKKIENKRRIWTSDGVHDTLVVFF